MLPRELADKLSARSGELTNHDMELLRKLAKDHEAATQLALRQRQTDTMERVLQERTERLDAAALSLARGEAELEDGWQKFHAERNTFNAQVERQRQKLDDDRKRIEAELAAQKTETRPAVKSPGTAGRRAGSNPRRANAIAARNVGDAAGHRGTLGPAFNHRAPGGNFPQRGASAVETGRAFQNAGRRHCRPAPSGRNAFGQNRRTARKHGRAKARVRSLVPPAAARFGNASWQTDGPRKRNRTATRRMQQVQLQWECDRRELEHEIRRLQSELRHAESGQFAA